MIRQALNQGTRNVGAKRKASLFNIAQKDATLCSIGLSDPYVAAERQKLYLVI